MDFINILCPLEQYFNQLISQQLNILIQKLPFPKSKSHNSHRATISTTLYSKIAAGKKPFYRCNKNGSMALFFEFGVKTWGDRLLWTTFGHAHPGEEKERKFSLFIIISPKATFAEMNSQQFLNKQPLDNVLQRRDNTEYLPTSDDDQMDFISKYLDLRISPSLLQIQQLTFSNDFEQNNPSRSNPTLSQDSQPISRQLYHKKASVFHNFQKHLMTTLKSQIKIRKISHSSKSQSNIASQLWEYLKNSSKICKRFLLCLLLGPNNGAQSQKQKYYEDYSKMITELNEYSEKQINSAQQFLRREVIRQSHRLLQSNSFENRRMNNSQDFKMYFRKFVEELQEGKVSKRIPKASNYLEKKNEEFIKQIRNNIQ